MTSRINAKSQGDIQQVKVVLLGEQSVGKSCIAVRFTGGEFPRNKEATIGATFLTQTISFDTFRIKFDIWDTAGQERYRTLAPLYYRNAQAAIIVYDITRAETFLKAISWVDELKQQVSGDIFMILAGNKADLPNRVVLAHDAKQIASENGLAFYETSALSGDGIREVFTAIGDLQISLSEQNGKDISIPQDLEAKRHKSTNSSDTIKIGENGTKKKKCQC